MTITLKTTLFTTHDWMLMSAASRGEKLPKGFESRVVRLMDLGIIERGAGRTSILSRRFYEFVGKAGVYTRKKGLDRETNLALLKKHIEQKGAMGAKLQELCEVLPALPRTTVQSLLQTLKRRGLAHPTGNTNAGGWVPGPAVAGMDTDAGASDVNDANDA
jgi:ATP-dependent DNA helicase RecG